MLYSIMDTVLLFLFEVVMTVIFALIWLGLLLFLVHAGIEIVLTLMGREDKSPLPWYGWLPRGGDHD